MIWIYVKMCIRLALALLARPDVGSNVNLDFSVSCTRKGRLFRLAFSELAAKRPRKPREAVPPPPEAGDPGLSLFDAESLPEGLSP